MVCRSWYSIWRWRRAAARLRGSIGAEWDQLIDGVTTGYDGGNGFGYTLWSPSPGAMTLDLKSLCAISDTKLLLWDLDSRYYQYRSRRPVITRRGP